jgi:hypothetical protein
MIRPRNVDHLPRLELLSSDQKRPTFNAQSQTLN